MNDKQLQVIAGMFAGLQLALVHVAKVLDSKGVAPSNELADSFRSTAANVPPEAANREIIALVLNQVAAGIESSKAPDPQPVLLRLIRGGKASKVE